jgi:hypothetical protein
MYVLINPCIKREMRHWIQGQDGARRISDSHPFSCVQRHAELRNKKRSSFLYFVTKLTLAYFPIHGRLNHSLQEVLSGIRIFQTLQREVRNGNKN